MNISSNDEMSKKKALKIFDVAVPTQRNLNDCGPLMIAMMKRLAENEARLIKELK